MSTLNFRAQRNAWKLALPALLVIQCNTECDADRENLQHTLPFERWRLHLAEGHGRFCHDSHRNVLCTLLNLSMHA